MARLKSGGAAFLTPVQFFSRLTSFNSGQFSLVGRPGSALLSVHNSGSNAERDFSLLVGLFLKIGFVLLSKLFLESSGW